METIEFNGKIYPKFQSEGFASQFAFPYAKKVCKGVGFDVGCNRIEWSFPGSIPIDPTINIESHALKLPYKANYIFSSHMLEHVDNWVDVLNYWHTMLLDKGILFLYLPDYSQEYWRPYNNRKHIHIFTPQIMQDFFLFKKDNWENTFVSGVDLNNSFMVIAQKK